MDRYADCAKERLHMNATELRGLNDSIRIQLVSTSLVLFIHDSTSIDIILQKPLISIISSYRHQ